MSIWKGLAISALGGVLFAGPAAAPAQIAINIGSAPACPYGYFDYTPYDCAPYGYYGPDWFANGLFIGAGPWYRGSRGFYGHVDNRFDPHFGYRGPLPGRGDRPFETFRGNEGRDGRGHVGNPGHDGGSERFGGYQGFRGGARYGGNRDGGNRGGGRGR